MRIFILFVFNSGLLQKLSYLTPDRGTEVLCSELGIGTVGSGPSRTVNLAGGPEVTLFLHFPAAHTFSKLVDGEAMQPEEGSLVISHTS